MSAAQSPSTAGPSTSGGVRIDAGRGSADAPTPPGHRPLPVPVRQGVTDAVALVVLLGLGVLAFGPTFGGNPRYAVAGFGAIALGLGLAWEGARRGWRTWHMVNAVALTYLVAGSALAAPQEALGGVLPTLQSLRVIVLGVVLSWKDLLTVAAPVGTGSGMLVVPFLSVLVCSVVAGTLAWRIRAFAWTLVPVLVLFSTTIALGTDRAPLPSVRGTLLILVAMAWLAYRRDVSRAGSLRRAPVTTPVDPAGTAVGRNRRLALGAGMLAVATLLTLAVTPLVTGGSDRQVLRDAVEPPVDLYAYPSPLTSFRKYVKDSTDEVLFTVEGLPEGERVRLAALDTYDGVVYNVNPQAAGNFSRVGDAQQLGTDDDDPAGTRAQLKFTIGDYTGVWLPAGGDVEGVRLDGPRAEDMGRSLYYNDDARTTLSTIGVQQGDTYEVNAVFPEKLRDEQLAQYGFAQLSLPRVLNDPPVIAATSSEYIGSASEPLERARRLEQVLSAQGYFSNGKDDEARSLPGHGAARMLSLLDADQMVGDDEQYAVAMALMARKANMPARVVMGFYPDWDEIDDASAPVEITGEDVHAWVEIAFDNVGWVPFDPTPPEDNEPVPPQQQPKSSPKPQVLQPPPPPQEPAELPPDSAPEPQDAEEREKDLLDEIGPVLTLIGLAAIPLVLLALPLVIVAALKARRRKRRRFSGEPAHQIGGGWNEVVSLVTDLGAEPDPRSTRRESAAALGEAFPSGKSSTALLARRADAGIFGSGQPSADEVEDYWRSVDTSLGDLTGSVGYWKRQRARYSPRSLLRERRLRRSSLKKSSRG
ncbi:MAG: hypothetical protein JWM61_2707 [Micrococcaceae bacterium]|nr:hypothetical protein [Micrococcaceae bacterium]